MTEKEDLCWICFSEEGQDKTNNPFVVSCKCQGETQYSHSNCLKEWITTSGKIKCLICNFSYSVPFKYEKENRVPHYHEIFVLFIFLIFIVYPLAYLIYTIYLIFIFIQEKFTIVKAKMKKIRAYKNFF